VYVFHDTDDRQIFRIIALMVQLLSDQGASDTLQFMETVNSQLMSENIYLIFVYSIGLISTATTRSSGR
jgi:hypothetical protein